MKKDDGFSYLGVYEKMLKQVSKSLEIYNQMNSANILGITKAIKPYLAFTSANSNSLRLAGALQKTIDASATRKTSIVQPILGSISSVQALIEPLEIYKSILYPDSLKKCIPLWKPLQELLLSNSLNFDQ
ncbi:MAG: hypothetical protein ACI4CT_08775 [Lachnospiraceae bacterium]